MSLDEIAGVVVIYNPDQNVVGRIIKLSKQVNYLLVYDNSETSNNVKEKICSYTNVYYESHGINNGISIALNRGIEFANKNKCNYLLTSDQDTDFPEDYVKKMLMHINCIDADIIGPNFIDRNNKRYAKFPVKKWGLALRKSLGSSQDLYFPVFCLITSGAIHRLSLFDEIGVFRNDYFIDYVDNEFCLRANSRKKRVYAVSDMVIEHSLGERTIKKAIVKFSPTNYSSLRKYYMTRNRFDVYFRYIAKYPFFVLYDFSAFLLDLFRCILFEENKLSKLDSMSKGFNDFIHRRFGKYKF